MKRFCSLLVTLCLVLFLIPVPGAAAPELTAKAAILIDAGTGRILYEKNVHERLPQASTTKITTALVALEKEPDLQKKLKVPADFINPGESGIWLEPGEVQTLHDMLYALLLRSANDSAELIALAIGGSEPKFVQMMNEKVKKMGLKDTHYENPHGLDTPNHYSSAYDLAMLAREALKNNDFRKIIVTNRHVLPWGGHDYSRVVYNHNRLLTRYEGADGVKNGYTKDAGNCLVGSATRNGLQLIAVVMHSNGMYDEVGELLDYGFNNYQGKIVFPLGQVLGRVSVQSGREEEIKAVASRGMNAALRRYGNEKIEKKVDLPETVKAPVKKGQKLGTVTLKIGAKTTVQVDLVAADAVKKTSLFGSFWETIRRIFSCIF